MYKLEIEPSEILHTKFGTAHINTYYQIKSRKEGNKDKLLHRLIFEDFYGTIPKDSQIHHKDNNKLNNCILNLELISEKNHRNLHKFPSSKTKKKMSQVKTTTGYFRVYKKAVNDCKQGFCYVYQYYENGKRKGIRRKTLKELECAVKQKGLKWEKFGDGY